MKKLIVVNPIYLILEYKIIITISRKTFLNIIIL